MAAAIAMQMDIVHRITSTLRTSEKLCHRLLHVQPILLQITRWTTQPCTNRVPTTGHAE